METVFTIGILLYLVWSFYAIRCWSSIGLSGMMTKKGTAHDVWFIATIVAIIISIIYICIEINPMELVFQFPESKGA